MKLPSWKWGLLLAAFAFAVRLFHLSDAAPWEDEAFRVDLARGDLAHYFFSHADLNLYVNDVAEHDHLASTLDSLRYIRDLSPYPPLYFLLLRVALLVSTAPAWLSVLNALVGACTALMLWLVFRRFMPAAWVTLGIVLWALSPWDLGIGMQLKESGVATALGFSALAATVWAVDGEGWRRWVLPGAVWGLALLTQQQTLFWLPVLGLYALTAKPVRARLFLQLGVAGVVGLSLFAPWAVFAGKKQIEHLQGANLQFGGQWGGLADLPRRLHIYLVDSLEPLTPPAMQAMPLVDVLALVVLLTTIVALALRVREGVLRGIAVAGMVWLGALLGVISAYVVMRQNQALWSRYSVLFLPAAWMGVAGLGALASQRLRPMVQAGVSATALVVVLLLTNHAFLSPIPLDRYADWRPPAQLLIDEANAGELVVHNPGSGAWCPLVHQLKKGTRHVALGDFNEDLGTRVYALAEGKPVWVVMSWGFDRNLERWKQLFEGHGYRMTLGPVRPVQPPYPSLLEALPERHILAEPIVIVRFDPS